MPKLIQRDDLLRFCFLSALEVGPDEKALIYRKTRMDKEKNRYYSHWRLRRLDLDQDIALTSEATAGAAHWLDKETVIFAAEREEKEGGEGPELAKTRLYRLATTGGEAQLWKELPYAVNDFRPLPDGRLLLAVTQTAEQRALEAAEKLDDAKAKAEAQKAIKEERDYQVITEAPFWMNGGSYTVGDLEQLYLYDPETGKAEVLGDAQQHRALLDLQREGEAYRILYSEWPREELMHSAMDYVYLWDSRTGKAKMLNPKGQRMAYHEGKLCGETAVLLATDGKEYGINEDPYFYLYSEDEGFRATGTDAFCGGSTGTDICYGGGRQFLGVGPEGPLGAGLYFVQQRGRDAKLCFYSLDTGKVQALHETEGAVNCFDLAGDQLYFIGLRELRGQELYRMDVEGQECCLTGHNDWLRDYSLAQPESLCFVSSDGQEQEGFVLLPPEGAARAEGAKLPGILTVHGGPKTCYGTVLMHEMQLLAAEGYAVFYTNPHGSDGYGRAWADIRGHYGEADYEDLMRFTDRVLEAYPQINGKQLAVMGGSYGGFMTNWVIGHTERFRAAITQRSISNWASMYGISDIGYYFSQDQTAANPWDNPELLWAQSPLRYAPKMKTPTLIIHSDADYRCPIAEGYQLFTALKIHGVPSRMVCFKGENHELSRGGKPLHRLRRLREIQDWLAQYLRG